MESGDRAEPAPELRSYGRRRGRKLSPRQQTLVGSLLPTLQIDLSQPAPALLPQLFPSPVSEVWLEIGFGGGEHLLWQARHHPQVGIIGAEPFIDGVVKATDAVQRDGLPNVRLHGDDVRPLLDWLPGASLSRVFVLFPDPWPKRKHRKRRLFARPLLDRLARVLATGAELRFASDIADYAADALIAAVRHPDFEWQARRAADWRSRPADWPGTRYEAKADREGRRSTFLSFRRR